MISDFRQPVEWRLLDRYQQTLDAPTFERRMRILSPDGGIWNYVEVENDVVRVFASADKQEIQWELHLANEGQARRIGPHPFHPALVSEFTGADPENLPLRGVRIALDPGHIGGDWSRIEERHFSVGGKGPVKEGDLTRIVAEHLAVHLEEAGAEVHWVVREPVPATDLRPGDLTWLAIESLFPDGDNPVLQRLSLSRLRRNIDLRAQAIFYRGAEISARAESVRAIAPDLTLCIHYNAAPWGRSGRPRLVRANKLVIFVHGSYTASELEIPEQRFHLFRKLLEGAQEKEYDVSVEIARQMQEVWGLPPENYGDWNVTHQVGESPYVWSRNLLANRLFDGATIFVEGPYMNDTETFYRLVEGDYEGERTIRGQSVRSIHREFAEIIAAGVIEYYRQKWQ